MVDSDDQLHGAQLVNLWSFSSIRFLNEIAHPLGMLLIIVGAPCQGLRFRSLSHDCHMSFLEAMLRARLLDSIDPTIADMRMNLRDYPFVTIDGGIFAI